MTDHAIGEEWSAWRPVAGLPAIDSEVLAEILDGGQAFRWHRNCNVEVGESENGKRATATWCGTWRDNIARLRLTAQGTVEWSAPAAFAPRVGGALLNYFGGASDFAALSDSLPWRSDAHLARCVETFRGLRILRQPFGETLLGFLCSATKQIVQIKQMLALLAERHGTLVAADGGTRPLNAPKDARTARSFVSTFHRLPTWPELSQIPETELRACLLGFRARFISETARYIAAHPGWLEETERLPYVAAKERLCSLPGVGEKIADCVLLFGAGRLEAFPVDVWILKTMARRYGLDGWRPAQIAQFGRAHFGPLAGLAQQYLFAWERAQKKSAANQDEAANTKSLER